MKRRQYNLLYFFVFLLFLECTQIAPIGSGSGSGSQTGNPIVSGRVLNTCGKPVQGAVVRVVPVNYVPSISLQKRIQPIVVHCTTNIQGEYSIYSIDSGLYNFEATRDTIGIFVDSITIVPDSINQRLDDVVLLKLGRISGTTKMPGQSDTNQVRVTLYLPGTPRITKPAIGGGFQFDMMPQGAYQLIIDPTYDNYNVKVLIINLQAGQNLNLDTILLDVYEPDTIDVKESTVFGTWGPGKVYKIWNSITVPPGQKLRILPGTTIRLFGRVGIHNEGQLLMQGKPDSMISVEHGLRNDGSSKSMTNFPLGAPEDTSLLLLWVKVNGMTEIVLHDNAVISNCIFANCKHALQFYNFSEPKGVLKNCIFWKNSCALYQGDTLKINATNCIFVGNMNCTKNESNSPFTIEFNFCSFFDNFMLPERGLVKNSIIADPEFVSSDSLNTDFHLQAGSPCRKAGINGTDIGLFSAY